MSIEKEAKEFLVFFAKFEFALKSAGYVFADDKKRAKPDWDELKKGISDLGIDRDDKDIKELLKKPPRVQLYHEGKLTWKERDSISSDAGFIEACLTIRNNLFHGGKIGDSDSTRNCKLLRAAKKILEAVLEKKHEVKQKFDLAYL